MKEYHTEKAIRPFVLKPRYAGSYAAMVYGLAMAVFGHVWSRPTTASAAGLVFYGDLLYHARKRLRFRARSRWLALDVYAGLSVTWMVANILTSQAWKWHPIAFGLIPLVVIGGYLIAFM